jgi:hypothetical protein
MDEDARRIFQEMKFVSLRTPGWGQLHLFAISSGNEDHKRFIF